MSKTLLILFFIFNSFLSVLSAQNQNEKSDLSIQEQIVVNLIESSVSHRNSDRNLSVEICEKAIKLAEKEQADSLLAVAYKTQGINYYILREDDSSRVYYEKALSKFNEVGNLIQAGKVLGNIGLIFKRRGEYTKALEYYFKEIDIFYKIKYMEGLPSIYTNLGGIFVLLEEYKKAEDRFSLALKIAKENGNSGERLNALNNLGVLFENQDRFNEALNAYEESLSLVLDRGNSVMESKLYLNIGVIYRRIGDFQKADQYLKKSFDIRKLRGNYDELSTY